MLAWTVVIRATRPRKSTFKLILSRGYCQKASVPQGLLVEDSFPHHVVLLKCPYDIASVSPQSKGYKTENKEEATMTLMTQCCFCHNLFVRSHYIIADTPEERNQALHFKKGSIKEFLTYF